MARALLRVGKQILRAEILFGAGFTIGSIYVGVLLTVPRLLAVATRLL